jgi:elongation factor G
VEQADKLRHEMLDSLSLVSDELTEAILEDKVTPELLRKSLREATIALKCTPVMCGSALGNKGVQLLLDGVCSYLPEPRDVENVALDLDKNEEPVVLESNPDKPLIMLAFKLEDGRYGQLTYVRVYQGKVRKDDFIVNARTGKKVKVGRLVRMHSDDKEEITDAGAGDICAMFGVDCNSGDTFTDGTVNYARSRSGPRTRAPRSTCPRRSTGSPRRTPRSSAGSIRNRTRPSSPAWASSTSTSTSSA